VFQLGATPATAEIPVCFVGFASVYRMFAYPDKLKQRVCQFLVLPHFQRQVCFAPYTSFLFNVFFAGSRRSFDEARSYSSSGEQRGDAAHIARRI
jgi:hypothetical protein